MSSTELTVSSLGDAVRDKVRGAIFNSIPDEAIQGLLENEFKYLQTKRYNSDDKNPLQLMIFEEIKKQVKIRVDKAVLEHINLTFKSDPSGILNNAIKEMAPHFMTGMMESFAASAVQQLKNNIQNNRVY